MDLCNISLRVVEYEEAELRRTDEKWELRRRTLKHSLSLFVQNDGRTSD